MTQPRVFLATPSYGGVCPETVGSIMQAAEHATVLTRVGKPCSLLAMSFNSFWCQALNLRKELNITHFAMIHADVEAEAGWLDRMLGEQKAYRADVLSRVLPIKNKDRVTSTALYYHATKTVERLSSDRAMQLPCTFDNSVVGNKGTALLVNTGLWVCDFTQPWVEKVHFAILDSIVRQEDGSFQPLNFPEDWNFSLQCVGLGLRVFATRCVKAKHIGLADYSVEEDE